MISPAVCTVVVSSILGLQQAGAEPATAATPSAAADVARYISDALQAGTADAPADAAQVARDVEVRLGRFTMWHERLSRLTDPATTGKAELPALLKNIAADLTFRPRREAPVPPGWPEDAPVGVVVMQSYPAYRVAETTPPQPVMQSSSMFFTLFRHITRRDIPMTAPVEMGYDSRAGLMEPVTMGFLYPDSKTGTAGEVAGERVTVRDVAPMTVLSVAHRGRFDGPTTIACRKLLTDWLAANPAWEANGDVRVFGWNGPGTPPQQCYTQVQLPVKAATGKPPTTRP